MSQILAIHHLCKSFPGVRALHNAAFELESGEVHALMGENGAGKSTLMKIIAGVYTRDSGEIIYEGRPVEIHGPKHAQDLGIGIIHQELNLMNHLSAAQNIFIGREPRKLGGLVLDENKLNADASAIFAQMNLKLDPRVQVGDLTVAKQQMVEIAKALSFHSKILIMDEPTAALNNAEIDDLFAIIRALKAKGVGIIYISHKMDEIRRISDRITVMRDGEYIGTKPAANTDISEIIHMMVGRALETHEPPKSLPGDHDVVLEVKDLNRGQHIRDVSFRLHKGEILGFAGLMGAGRTEVARAIFGADPIDSGDIIIHGKKVTITSPKDAVKNGIGYLSEDRKRFGLATSMDVSANIVMASLSRFLKRGLVLDRLKIVDATKAHIQKLAIKTPSAEQTVRLLSGGNQQKIVIAKWLERDCDILFFDEPTRGIDVGAKAEIYKLINALAAQGKAIVMISSELPEILRMSHRILVMCEGRITGELKTEQADQEKIMQLATLCNSTAA